MLSCDGSSITLAWKSPKHCGGSKVNAYYIDKRDADTLTWKEVNLAAVTERICKVSEKKKIKNKCWLQIGFTFDLNHFAQVEGLKEGTFYEFKITAANMAGLGVPSDPSAPLKCEAWTMDTPGLRLISDAHSFNTGAFS